MLFDPSFPYYAIMSIEMGFLLFLLKKKINAITKFESFKYYFGNRDK